MHARLHGWCGWISRIAVSAVRDGTGPQRGGSGHVLPPVVSGRIGVVERHTHQPDEGTPRGL